MLAEKRKKEMSYFFVLDDISTVLLFQIFSHSSQCIRNAFSPPSGEYWMIYWGLAFLRSCDSAPRPPSLPRPFSLAGCPSFSVFLCVAGRASEGERAGVEPHHREKAWPSIFIQYPLPPSIHLAASQCTCIKFHLSTSHFLWAHIEVWIMEKIFRILEEIFCGNHPQVNQHYLN